MAGLLGSPEWQELADKSPEEYYKKTPFVRSLWEGRLPTWLGQAYEQDVEPAIDKLPSPTTMEGALTYAKMPYELLKTMATSATDTIKTSMDDPTNPRKALELALMTGAGGRLLGRAPEGAGQVLGVFAGRGAKTANLGKMKVAQKMLDDGVDRTDVWKQTGWMRGPDGKMRFEIDDSGSRFNIDAIPPSESRIDMAGEYLEAVHGVPKNQLATGKNPDLDKEAFAWVDENMHLKREGETTMAAALTHSDAFAAYPEAKNIRLGREASPDLSGSFNPRENKITVGGGVIGQGADVPRSTALHEFQHAIQTKEDFAHGGFPTGPYGAGELDEYAKLIYDNIKDIPANAGATKSELYQHAKKFAGSQRGKKRRYILLAGEAEARNVQTRRDMTPEQRLAEPPWTTLDVPESDMIVRGATDGPQMSLPMDEASRMARAKETAEMRRKGNIERFGYDPNDAASTAAFEDTSYRMQHQPRGPDSDDPIRLDELTRSTNGNTAGYPDDFYGSDGSRLYAPGPRFSGDEYGISNIESYNIAKKVRGNPEGVVTIYRAVPNEDKINKINQGDFVTLSPKYAEVHGSSGYGRSGNDPGKIISEEVKVKDVYWAGDDINEFGYFPQSSTKTPKAQPSPAMLRALLKDPDVL